MIAASGQSYPHTVRAAWPARAQEDRLDLIRGQRAAEQETLHINAALGFDCLQ
jgi:hypothetical protein